MSHPPLRTVYGERDLLDLLEAMVEKVKAGEVDAIAIATVEQGQLGMGYAYRDDLEHAWSRISSSVSSMHHCMMANGL